MAVNELTPAEVLQLALQLSYKRYEKAEVYYKDRRQSAIVNQEIARLETQLKQWAEGEEPPKYQINMERLEKVYAEAAAFFDSNNLPKLDDNDTPIRTHPGWVTIEQRGRTMIYHRLDEDNEMPVQITTHKGEFVMWLNIAKLQQLRLLIDAELKEYENND